MRKFDREIKSFYEIVDVISRCDTIRLGINDADAPYIVPVSFGFEVLDGKLAVYFHGAKAGRKAELLRSLPRVCIEADICHGFPSNGHGGYTCDYESVIGYGYVELLEGEEAVKGVKLLNEHCGIHAEPCPPEAMAITAVNRVVLDELSGKRRNLGDPNA
ncbi:MAG: 5-nitroimidazole antibiotic resistance protein [Clostridiales bacterium]|nr:5-nitroimidazole antibiotic resistance protein [Clostridiales bacterium]